MKNYTLVGTKLSPRLAAAFILAMMLLLVLSQQANAQSPASCQQVLEYSDTDGNGRPDTMVLSCQFTPDSNDRLTIHKTAGTVAPDIPWQENLAYEGETWIFDHGAQGRASLIITFIRDGNSLAAQLCDDRDQDGQVRYEISDGQVVITESPHWTIQIVAPDGWWMRDNALNYNLRILVDGDVEGMFSMESYREYLVTDGVPDYDIRIYDQNSDGRPEFDKRMILTDWLQGSVGLGTQMMANWEDDELPIGGGFSLWPYLDVAYQHTRGTRVVKGSRQTPPPIKYESNTGRIEAIGEFVASRGSDHNCFYYSGLAWLPGRVNESDNENPFCFYDLASDGDGHPELQIRMVYWPPNDPSFLGGSISDPYNLIRYSWDQENTQTWRYAVGLVGSHLIDDVVTFSDIDVLTVPYRMFPKWVTDQTWDMAVFSEFTGKSYFTSEGNYSVNYPEDRMFVEYYTGKTDRSPSPEFEPEADFKMEWAMDYGSQPYLYFSSVDQRLHLSGAQGGIWNLGNGHLLRYANLDGDAHLDQWQEERNGAVVQQLNYADGNYISSGNGGVQIKQTDVGPALFETQPPASHEDWQRLGAQLSSYQTTFSPTDFAAMLSQLAGPVTRIEGAAVRDYRITSQGLRFVLELQDDFSVDHEQDALLPLPEAPGTYVVEYDGQAWSVRPAAPAMLRVSDAQLNAPDGVVQALHWATLDVLLRNDGLEDVRDLPVCVTLDNQIDRRIVMTDTVALLPGEGEQLISWDWAPPAAGAWQVQVAAYCSDSEDASSGGELLAKAVVSVAGTDKPSASWLASLGGRIPESIGLFLFATVAMAGAAATTWIKRSSP